MRDFSSEIGYQTARSGGKGGQNVNKVETMVEAYWQPLTSFCFTDDEKQRILTKLQNKVNEDGYISVRSSATRSQLENKAIARQKLLELVDKALHIAKKRVPTTATKAAKEKRLLSKKKESIKKESRKKNMGTDD